MSKNLNRRSFIKNSSVTGLAAILLPAISSSPIIAATHNERSIKLHNTHTGESFKQTYWEKGKYIEESMKSISTLLRDHRTNDIIDFDPKLIDYLYLINQKLDNKNPINIVSGYRSPETNRKLRRQGRGVAKNSFHMYGRAVDFYIPEHAFKIVKKAAFSVSKGGVGDYPYSGFIHIDTGPLRRW